MGSCHPTAPDVSVSAVYELHSTWQYGALTVTVSLTHGYPSHAHASYVNKFGLSREISCIPTILVASF